MSRKMVGAMLMVGAWALVPIPAAAQAPAGSGLPPGDEAAVREVERAYTDAWEANDRAAVMALVAEGAAIVPSGMAPIVGRAAIEAFWFPVEGPATTVTRYSTEIDEVGGSDGLGWVRGTGRLDFEWEADGRVNRRSSRNAFLMVVERATDGAWRIRNRMWNDLGAE